MKWTAGRSLISGFFCLNQSVKMEHYGTADTPEKKCAYLIKVEREFRSHPSVGGHGGAVAVADMNQPADTDKERDKNGNLRQVRLFRIDKLRHQ